MNYKPKFNINKVDDVDEQEVNMTGLMIESIVVLVMKTLNYSFMLVAMTFNFYIVLTIAAGQALAAMVFEYHSDKNLI